VDRDVAGAYVVVVHAALLLPMIGLGQLFLLAQHASLGALWRAGQSDSAEGSGPPTPPVGTKPLGATRPDPEPAGERE
jgi:hypothetical protein